MQKKIILILLLGSTRVVAQEDTAISRLMNADNDKIKTVKAATPIFYSQKLINANTVEVLHKGILQFRVVHNFGDAGGANGGISNFFGLDAATDIKLALQAGLTDKLNVLISRSRGDYHSVAKLVETGLKYQFLKQMDNDPKHPLSLTLFANMVVSTMKASPFNDSASIYTRDDRFKNFSDRGSQVVQLMIARRFGNISLQLSPTYVHTNFVVPNDKPSLFALGMGARIPLSRKFILVADYFHTFRSGSSKEVLEKQFVKYGDPLEANRYDVFGIGVEILTSGHMFHLNFTNATSSLENRFVRRTYTSWGKGQYRWGFTIARDFVLFRDKNKK